jgi:hypothetical protein
MSKAALIAGPFCHRNDCDGPRGSFGRMPSRLAILGLFAAMQAGAAGDEESPRVACDDQFAECKEGCTLNFGTSFQTREALNRCLTRCTRSHQSCLQRFLEAKRSGIDPAVLDKDATSRDVPPAVPEKARYPRSEQDPGPTPTKAETAPSKRDATRGTELGNAPNTEPEAYPSSPSAPTPRDAGTPNVAPPLPPKNDPGDWAEIK